MGEQIPIKWLRLEQAFTQLVENNSFFSSLDQAGLKISQLISMQAIDSLIFLSQIEEVAMSVGLNNSDELKTVLEFYHDLGVIVYYGGAGRLDLTLRNTVILQPQWLIDMFKRIITLQLSEQLVGRQGVFTRCSYINDESFVFAQSGINKELWYRLRQTGLLDERLIDHVWADIPHQKVALLALMQKFDLIAERLPAKTVRLLFPISSTDNDPEILTCPLITYESIHIHSLISIWVPLISSDDQSFARPTGPGILCAFVPAKIFSTGH